MPAKLLYSYIRTLLLNIMWYQSNILDRCGFESHSHA